MDQNNEDMCVICFKRDSQKNFSCLYKNENDLTEIGRQYQDIVQTSVTNFLNVLKSPKYLCQSCEKNVKSYNRFRTQVIQSYWRILKVINPICTTLPVDKYVKIEEVTIIDANTDKETEKFQIKYLYDDIEDNNDDNVCTGENKPQSFSPKVKSNTERQNSSKNQCNLEENQSQISDKIMETDEILDTDKIIVKNNKITNNDKIVKNDKIVVRNDEIIVKNDKITNNDKIVKNDKIIVEINKIIKKDDEDLKSSKQSKAILCRLCLRAFKLEIDFQKHMIDEHKRPEFKHKRNNLEEKTVKISNKIVNDYLKTGKSMDSFDLGQNSNAILCRLCTRAFKFESDFLKHMSDVHNDVVKFKCKQCNLLYKTYEQLLHHTETKHSDRTIKCPICKKNFAHRSTYNAHKKMHLDERP